MSRDTWSPTKTGMPWHWWAMRYGVAAFGLFWAMGFGVIGNTAEREGWTWGDRIGGWGFGLVAVMCAAFAIHFPRLRRRKGSR